MLELKNIKKTYYDKKEEYQVLKGINLSIPNRGIFLVTGKSGSGKSTLLKIIGLTEKCDTGNIIWNNKELEFDKEEEKSEFHNREVGIVYQNYELFEFLTVLENITLLYTPKNLEELWSIFDIENLKNKKIADLSGGEQQRVSIVRALASNPNILILDEPTSNLDKQNKERILEYLKQLSQKKLIIIASHETDITNYADSIYNVETNEMKIINHLKDIEIKKHSKETLSLKKVVAFAKHNILENKKKLLLTTFLLLLSFTTGLISFSLKSFDPEHTHTNAMEEEKKTWVYFYTHENESDFSEEEKVKQLQDSFGKDKIQVGTLFAKNSQPLNFECANSDKQKPIFYDNSILYPYFYVVNDYSFDKDNLIGNLPVNDFEMVVHEHLIELLFYDGNEVNALDYLNQEVVLDGLKLKIVGIIKQDTKPYEILKQVYWGSSLKLQEIFQLDISVPSVNVYVNPSSFKYLKNHYDTRLQDVYYINNDTNKWNSIFEEYPISHSKIRSLTPFSSSILEEQEKMSVIQTVFLFVCFVITLISIIFLVNYMESSIFNHKKEIKNLKNLGVENKKIKSIYFLETVMLMTITFLISLILFIFISHYINREYTEMMLFKFYPMVINPLYIMLIYIILVCFCFLINLLILKGKKIK